MSDRPLVAVLGGGISGLAAAHRLSRMPDGPRVVLIEACERLGGRVRRAEVGGVSIDAGPDSILARVPWGRELLEELGLQSRIATPEQLDAHIFTRGRLRPLPPGLMAGRASGAAIRRSGLLTARGRLRAALDLVGLGRRPDADESIAAALGGRLGAEVVRTIADPLVAGVYAGSAQRISSRTVAPAVASARRQGGSLLRAMKRSPGSAERQGPAFLSLQGGLWQLPGAIGDELAAGGVDIRLSTKAASIAQSKAGVTVTLDEGRDLVADAAVVALPAGPTAQLIGQSAPGAAAVIGAIEHATVALAAFAFRPGDLPALPRSSGFLVAPEQGRAIKACTLISQKWPQLAPGGPALLRCSLGLADAPPPESDAELLELARRDLDAILGIRAEPLDTCVSRFEDALPQLEVGHLERIAQAEKELEAVMPRVAVAGAWMRGIGVATCIRDGRSAAESAIIHAAQRN